VSILATRFISLRKLDCSAVSCPTVCQSCEWFQSSQPSISSFVRASITIALVVAFVMRAFDYGETQRCSSHEPVAADCNRYPLGFPVPTSADGLNGRAATSSSPLPLGDRRR
jgi:hypothetical protein